MAAFATRYLVLGYLPIALLYVAVRGRATRASTRYFWIPFAIGFTAYSGWASDHVLAALQHAQESGTGLAPSPSVQLRGLVLAEAFGRTAPTFVLAAVGTLVVARRALLLGNPRSSQQLFVLAWLALGSLWMILYHCAFAHDLTMESNLVMAVIFGAVSAGLGIELVAPDEIAFWRQPLRVLLLVGVLAVSAYHAAWVVEEDRTWPDWRPVIEAAHARGVDHAQSIWSTADNGGMRNTWGVRLAQPEMAGNVWQLRAELGPAVEVGSPWRTIRTAELLRSAAREGVDFVIGPLPFPNLSVDRRLYGYVISDVVDVPYGPASYILRRAPGA